MHSNSLPCQNACLINAVAGLDDQRVLESFCGNAGAGVPGLTYPLPINQPVAISGTFALEIGPKTGNGMIPFALLVDETVHTDGFITITSITDGAGDLVGIKGDGIATNWPLENFIDAKRLEAGLPNLPPNIGVIDSSHPMTINLANSDSAAIHNLVGTLFGVIPRKQVRTN